LTLASASQEGNQKQEQHLRPSLFIITNSSKDATYLNQKELNMKKMSAFGMAFVAGAVVLAGCADQPTYQSQYPSQQYPSQGYPAQGYPSQGPYVGTVDRMELINRSDPNNIAGTVIGGIIGGLIGHQIGGGSGQTVATIAGAAGGAYAGSQVQQRRRAPNETFRVTVRMDNGTYQTITEDNITDLRTGDRVRVDGNTISRY
jgi:outer membrane lipoprotein SlyB